MTTTMTDHHRPDITNSLFDENKRQNLFQILENKKADIILLQETHLKIEEEKKWQKKVERKIILAFGQYRIQSFWSSNTLKRKYLDNITKTKL